MKCGRNLLQTIFEYYQNTGVIAAELTTEIFKKPQKSRSRKIRKKRNMCYKNGWTPRSPAPLHFQTLNMHYESERSGEDPGSTVINASSSMAFDRRRDYRTAHFSSHQEFESGYMNNPKPRTFVVYPPSISIIDFNVISRNDIEKFCALNKIKKWKRALFKYHYKYIAIFYVKSN